MSETRILVRLLQMYIPQNWEFGPAFSKLRGGFEPPKPPPWVRQCLHSTLSKYLPTSLTRASVAYLQIILYGTSSCSIYLKIRSILDVSTHYFRHACVSRTRSHFQIRRIHCMYFCCHSVRNFFSRHNSTCVFEHGKIASLTF
jgi:hypothetical protein